jgi:hypothetical protein
MIGSPVVSDRVRMIEQAVNLVNTFRYSKHGLPGGDVDEPWKTQSDSGSMSPLETRAYDAALAFLAKEFNLGPSPMASMQFVEMPAMDEDPGSEEEEVPDGKPIPEA